MHIQIGEVIDEFIGRTPKQREAKPEPERGEADNKSAFLKVITHCQYNSNLDLSENVITLRAAVRAPRI